MEAHSDHIRIYFLQFRAHVANSTPRILLQNTKPQTVDSKISNLKLQAFLKLITLGFHKGRFMKCQGRGGPY